MPLQEIDAAISAWTSGLGAPAEHLFRLSVAALCGGLIGLEREIRGRQAGFRTNLLVCVGSAMVMVVSISLATTNWPSHNTIGVQTNTDPGRIAYGVMGGIGFLGAGTIIHNKGSIRGLTTAAALWCVAAIGLGAGLGLYVTTLLATLIVVAVLWVLNYVEDAVPHMRYRSLVVKIKWCPQCASEAVKLIQSRQVQVIDTSIDRRDCEAGYALLTMNIGFTNKARYLELERELAASAEVELIATRETSV